MLLPFLASVLGIVATGGHYLYATSLAQARNTIEGRVTTNDNRVLDNVRVLLQSDTYSPLQTVYTDGSGRYRFQGIATGTYYVQVEPSGNYDRQTQRIEVNPISGRRTSGIGGGGGEIFRADFVLSLPRPTGAIPATGIVFSQTVPDAARKEYARSLKSLEKDDFETAAAALKQSLEIFPDYYDALDLLGSEMVKRSDFQSALPLLERAVEVYKDGWHPYYVLGVALSETKQHSDALKTLRRAVHLNPNSVNANMRLGMELGKDEGTLAEAIQVLKKAAQLADNRVPDCYYSLAMLYNKNKQYSESADALESYLKCLPKTSDQAEQREKIKKVIDLLRQKASQPSARP